MSHRRTSTPEPRSAPDHHSPASASLNPADPAVTDGRRRLLRRHHGTRGGVLLAVIASALLTAAAMSSCSLAGKSLPALDESGRAISRARVDERRRAVASLDAFEARAHTLHRVGPTGWRDECSAGQDNFELHNPEAYRCSLTTVRLYTFAGDFRSQARQVGEDLVDGPCAGGKITDVERTLGHQYDRFVGTKPNNFPQGYTADALPASSGWCVTDTASGSSFAPGTLVADHWFTVPIPAAYENEDPKVLPYACGGGEHCHERPINVRAALGQRPAGDTWAVAVTTSREYWLVGWDGSGRRPDNR